MVDQQPGFKPGSVGFAYMIMPAETHPVPAKEAKQLEETRGQKPGWKKWRRSPPKYRILGMRQIDCKGRVRKATLITDRMTKRSMER